MKISVIIPVLNEEAAIQEKLPTLQWIRESGHELIMVDGGSIDNSTSGGVLTPLGASIPAVNETIVIKSILVTAAGTPSVTVTNNSITAIKSAALTANVTTELLTQPLIVEGGKTFTVQASTTDSFDVAISYLNIKKEVTT